jgi:thiamine pyrophosphate-dependent acetolactate synthase large subunit-like protein
MPCVATEALIFVHVRHEEYGAFAAVAEARLTGIPVAVCRTAGPGSVHLADTVAIIGGYGCSDAAAEVRALAERLNAPVGYSLKGKQFLEHNNPAPSV